MASRGPAHLSSLLLRARVAAPSVSSALPAAAAELLGAASPLSPFGRTHSALERALGGATTFDGAVESFEPVYAVRAYTSALLRLSADDAPAAVGPALRQVLRLLAKPRRLSAWGAQRLERESQRLAAPLAPLVARVIAAGPAADARATGRLFLRLLLQFPHARDDAAGARAARLALVETALGAAQEEHRLAWLPETVALHIKMGAADEALAAIAAARVSGTESERAIALRAATRLVERFRAPAAHAHAHVPIMGEVVDTAAASPT